MQEILGTRREDEIALQRPCGFRRRVDTLDRMVEIIDRLVRIAGEIFDGAAGKTGGFGGEDGLAGAVGAVTLALSRSPEMGRSVAATRSRQCCIMTSKATPPSGRAREKANPALLVASALKPSDARNRVVPGSHGLGINRISGP